MIAQDDSRFTLPNMKTDGCDVMVACWWLWYIDMCDWSTDSIEHMIRAMWAGYEPRSITPPISRDLYVNDWDKLAMWHGAIVSAPARDEPLDYVAQPHEQTVVEYARDEYRHVVAVAANNTVVYDPLRQSMTVRYGKPVRKIILTWARG